MAQLAEARASLKSRKITAAKKKLPEPPFLVPSVLETIISSKHGHLVDVVPGEADTYCAEEAAAHEARTGKMATIITNDSDLLIQASGAQTRVMLLGSLTRSRAPDPIKVEANVYFPAKLAAASGVVNLVPTAFFMSQDYHLSFDAAVAKAKKADLDDNAEFLAFHNELQKLDYDTSTFTTAVNKTLQHMDPRIAELAHQTMPGFPISNTQPASVFLVPLVEDVGRFSAWISGKEIRSAIYRMVLSGSDVRYIQEYTRSGTRCNSENLAPSPDWKAIMLHYEDILSSAKEFMVDYQATAAQRYNYVAMYIAIKAIAERGSKLLSLEELTRVLVKGRLHSREELHVSAMSQAAIYSLRMLKQLLALEKAKGIMDASLAPLDDLLGEMPALAELFEKSVADTTEFWEALAGGLLDNVVQE